MFSKIKWFGLTALGAVGIAAGIALTGQSPPAGPATEITVYRSPSCGCCIKWVDHVEAAGFRATVIDVENLAEVKAMNGITATLGSCHTAIADGYVIEGHVPASDIRRLLEERPAVAGLAVPGMPTGSPGMEGPNPQPYDVLAFDKSGRVEVFARH